MAAALTRLNATLIASNAILIASFVWKRELEQIVKHFCRRWLVPQRPSPPSPRLKEYLGRDYVPPLPRPVADVLERSCLCFLATAGGNEPHLSLMRFTYTASLEREQSEVMIISTRRDTKKCADSKAPNDCYHCYSCSARGTLSAR